MEEIPTVTSSDIRRSRSARKEVLAAPAAVITDIALRDDNSELIEVARTLGDIDDIVAQPRQGGHVEPNGVYRVEPRPKPAKDALGTEVLSTSHYEFALHSDHFFLTNPADYVLLHCWRCSPSEATYVAPARRICEEMSEAAFDALSTVPLMGDFGKRYILTPPRKSPTIHYNRYEIDKLAARGRLTVPVAVRPHFAALEDAAKRCAMPVPLAPGDCLVVNNKTVLHGRAAIAETSDRLLKRIRIHARH